MSGDIELSGEDYAALRCENETLRKMAERIAALVDCPDPICLTALAENDEETTADLLVKAVTRHGERLRAEVARLTAELGESVKLWLAEREAHAKTRKDLDFARSDQERTRDNFILHQFRADRAEAVLRGLREYLAHEDGVEDWDTAFVVDVLAKLNELER